jgi:hypothetical protein
VDWKNGGVEWRRGRVERGEERVRWVFKGKRRSRIVKGGNELVKDIKCLQYHSLQHSIHNAIQ